MLLVDYEVAVYLGSREVEDRHQAEEEQQGYGGDRDACARDRALTIIARDGLIEVYGSQSFLEAREHS